MIDRDPDAEADTDRKNGRRNEPRIFADAHGLIRADP
jgi:hypothetical protein